MGNDIVILGVVILVLLFTIAWLLLPFILLGTNRRLDTIIAQNRRLIEATQGRAQSDGERQEPFL